MHAFSHHNIIREGVKKTIFLLMPSIISTDHQWKLYNFVSVQNKQDRYMLTIYFVIQNLKNKQLILHGNAKFWKTSYEGTYIDLHFLERKM